MFFSVVLSIQQIKVDIFSASYWLNTILSRYDFVLITQEKYLDRWISAFQKCIKKRQFIIMSEIYINFYENSKKISSVLSGNNVSSFSLSEVFKSILSKNYIILSTKIFRFLKVLWSKLLSIKVLWRPHMIDSFIALRIWVHGSTGRFLTTVVFDSEDP